MKATEVMTGGLRGLGEPLDKAGRRSPTSLKRSLNCRARRESRAPS